MSYDLYFWKQMPACKDTPGAIVQAFHEGGSATDQLEQLDINAFVARVQAVFPGSELETYRHPETGEFRQLILDPEDTDWVVLVGWSNKHIEVESHGAPGETLNLFIDIAIEFDCPLYDPQTGVRYVG